MGFLPVVERELRVAARQRATYRVRLLAAGAAMAIAAVVLLFHALAPSPRSFGQALFGVLSGLLLLFCLVEGVRNTSDSLSEEKRAGTLGLLFLTDLRGFDVVLGKLFATSLRSSYALLGTLPLLGLAVLLGGVTGGEFWRVCLALVNVLFCSLCVGLSVSAFCRDGGRAFLATIGLLAALSIGPLLLSALLGFLGRGQLGAWLATLSPLNSYHCAGDLIYRSRAAQFWLGLLVTQLGSWFGLALAGWHTPRSWQEKAAQSRPDRASDGQGGVGRQDGSLRPRRLSGGNPVEWLFGRPVIGGQRRWLGVVVGAAMLLGLLAGLVLAAVAPPSFVNWPVAPLAWVIKIGLTWQVCRAFAEARQNSLLEMILGTPLSEREILEGHYLAVRQAWRWPVLMLVALQAVLFIASCVLARSPLAALPSLYVTGFGLITLSCDLLALFWAGSWFALTGGKANQAAVKTLLLVQVLPTVLCCGLRVVTDLVFFVWARNRMRTQLRAVAQKPVGQTRR